MRVKPGTKMPAIGALLLDGERWTLAAEKPKMLSLLFFYRGAFCPVCRTWLADVDRLQPEFDKRGISLIALSCDGADDARRSRETWGIKQVRMGCDLAPDDARQAGLYISEGKGLNPVTGIKEPRLFTEPGVLAVRPDGILYSAWVQSGPYARPHLAEILTALDTFIARDLPEPRGSA
jgi:peroxiredoxin